MATTPQQTIGIEQEYSYAYQGADGMWAMTKEEFEGHYSFTSERIGSIGTFWEIPLLVGQDRLELGEWPGGDWLGWVGAAIAQDGNIYSYGAADVGAHGLILNTKSDIGYQFDNHMQAMCGVVSHPNGKLYTIPAYGHIVEIDPLNKTSYEINPNGATNPDIFNGTGRNSGGLGTGFAKSTFCAAVVAPNNKCIYYIPDDADQVVKFNPATRTIELIGTQSGAIGYTGNSSWNTWNNSGAGKFCTGVLGPDGMIYMIGCYHRAIGKIDPYTDTVTWTHKAITNTELEPNAGADPDHWYRINSYQAWTGLMGENSNSYIAPMLKPTQAACLAPDGWIYILPYQYPWIMKYNPLLNIFRMHTGDTDWSTLNLNGLKELAVGTWGADTDQLDNRHKHTGAFVAADGNVYAGPGRHWVERGGGSTTLGDENTPTDSTWDNYNFSILKVITGVNAIPKDFTAAEKAQGFSTPAIRPQGNMAVNWSNMDDNWRTCILGPNGHMYCIPGKNKNGTTTLTEEQDGVTWDLPQGALEIHLGVVAKPAEELYGPYITTQSSLGRH